MLINMYKEHMEKEPKILYTVMLNKFSKTSAIGTKTIAKTISEYKHSGTVMCSNKKLYGQCLKN